MILAWFCSGATLIYRPSCNASGGCHSRPRHCSSAEIPAWCPQKSHYCIIGALWSHVSKHSASRKIWIRFCSPLFCCAYSMSSLLIAILCRYNTRSHNSSYIDPMSCTPIPYKSLYDHLQRTLSVYNIFHKTCSVVLCVDFGLLFAIMFGISTWFFYPLSLGLHHWHWGNRMTAQCQLRKPDG